jgi:hypothetical protein
MQARTRMPSLSSSGFTFHRSPATLNSAMMLMSQGPASSGSSVPITCSSSASPASLAPRFLLPVKPGTLIGTTGRPNFAFAALHTASRSSPIIADTQVE